MMEASATTKVTSISATPRSARGDGIVFIVAAPALLRNCPK